MQQEKNTSTQADPTSLTTQQLLREVSSLKELVFMRLEAIDTSIRVSHEDLVRVPTDVQKQVASLKELMEARINGSDRLKEEKFRNIDKRLDLVEQARIEQKKDTACVEANTPILCEDLIWRPAGELKIGDVLIAFDENAPTGLESKNGISDARRYRRSIVTFNELVPDELLEVVTTRGSVKCNPQHPFLVTKKSGADRQRWSWVKAMDIKPGEKIFSPLDVWEVETSWEAGWLAGMYDGEGWLYFDKNGPSKLGIVQRVSETADRIESALRNRLELFAIEMRKDHGVWNDTKNFIIRRRPDVMRILGSIRPPRLIINSDKTWEGRRLSSRDRETEVLSVTNAGVGVVASLSTTTKTYISAGFASHNTAVDAALKAAKEAVTEQNTSNVLAINKSETATTKQIDQQGVLIAQIIKNFDEKINDLKNKQVSTEGQIAALESMKGQVGVLMSGSSESKGKSAGIALVISLIVSAVAIIGLIIKYAGN